MGPSPKSGDLDLFEYFGVMVFFIVGLIVIGLLTTAGLMVAQTCAPTKEELAFAASPSGALLFVLFPGTEDLLVLLLGCAFVKPGDLGLAPSSLDMAQARWSCLFFTTAVAGTIGSTAFLQRCATRLRVIALRRSWQKLPRTHTLSPSFPSRLLQ